MDAFAEANVGLHHLRGRHVPVVSSVAWLEAQLRNNESRDDGALRLVLVRAFSPSL